MKLNKIKNTDLALGFFNITVNTEKTNTQDSIGYDTKEVTECCIPLTFYTEIVLKS